MYDKFQKQLKVLHKNSQNSRGNICIGVSFLIKLHKVFIKDETTTLVFSCKFCKMFNPFLWNTSGQMLLKSIQKAQNLPSKVSNIAAVEWLFRPMHQSRNLIYTISLDNNVEINTNLVVKHDGKKRALKMGT